MDKRPPRAAQISWLLDSVGLILFGQGVLGSGIATPGWSHGWKSFGVRAVESHISKARCGAPLFLVGREIQEEQWFDAEMVPPRRFGRDDNGRGWLWLELLAGWGGTAGRSSSSKKPNLDKSDNLQPVVGLLQPGGNSFQDVNLGVANIARTSRTPGAPDAFACLYYAPMSFISKQTTAEVSPYLVYSTEEQCICLQRCQGASI
jgi:hypothetical protein